MNKRVTVRDGVVMVRQPYGYDVFAASDAAAFFSSNPTLTQQHFKDEADINVIVDRFLKTGEVPQQDARAMYGDFLDVPESYQDALNAVLDAQDAFQALPAKIRDRFGNDPYELISWLHDPKNASEAIELGLLEKVEPAQAVPAAPVSSAPPTTSAEPGPVSAT